MKLVGVVSCYREGHLLLSTVRSLLGVVDEVALFEGPVAGAPSTGEASPLEAVRLLTSYPRLWVYEGTYKDDAEKRNDGLRWAKNHNADWLLWLDGDEVLIWGEYLRDLIYRADHETGVGGFPMRICELDGSVAYSYGRIVKPSVIRKYLLAASQAELHTGVVVGLPNEKICTAGGMPVQPAEGWNIEAEARELWLSKHRPPVGGEPHILHRSILRDPERTVERQHLAEARHFDEKEK